MPKYWDRPFGVEIEHGNDDHDCDSISLLLERKGFENWCDDIHYDGSGIEIPSPILQGKKGFNELKAVMTLLKKAGGYTTRRDGMHVHHDAPEYVDDVDALLRLLDTWIENKREINRMVAQSRPNNFYCSPLKQHRVEHIRKIKNEALAVDRYWKPKYWGKGSELACYISRYDISPGSLVYNRTIEIRLHEGTLDYDKAEAWIMFGQRLIESCLRRKRPIRCAKDTEVLLNRLRVPKSAKERLLLKA